MSPMSTFDPIALLRPYGQVVEVGGNKPFALDQPDDFWLVLEGQVEIFAIEPAGQSLGSGRTHLGTATTGHAMFGVGDRRPRLPFGMGSQKREGDAKLQAVGLQGTRLLKVQVARLQEVVRELEDPRALAPWIDQWLSTIFSQLRQAKPPKLFTALVAGKEIAVAEKEQVARSADGVVWVRHVEGSSLFLGREGLEMTAEGHLLPITDETWLVAQSPLLLSVVDTPLLLRSGGIWEGLARFHELLLRYLRQLVREATARERARLVRKLELDDATLEGAYRRLASVLGAPEPIVTRADDSVDPLFLACRLVGKVAGLDFKKPADTAGKMNLARLCGISRIRNRQVILRDEWWRQDNGPLLGFRMVEDGKVKRPVALLPSSLTSYELVDPVEQVRIPVTPEVAEGLAGDAQMFYQPLPERPLVFWDLIRQAVSGRQADLLTILAMGALGGLLAMLGPMLTGQVFGVVIPSSNHTLLWQMVAGLLLAAGASAAFQVTRSIAVLRLSGKMDGSLQSAVWDRLLALPPSFFRQYTVGDLSDRSMGIDAIRNVLAGDIISSALAAVFSVFSFALLFYYDPMLALAASALVALLVIVTGTASWLQLRLQREIYQHNGNLSSLLFGMISGVGKLRVAGAEQRAFALWADHFTVVREKSIAAQKVAVSQASFNAAYVVFSSMSLFAMVGFTMEKGMTLSSFLAFNAAFGQFQAAALAIVGALPGVLGIIPIYERLSPILRTAPEVDPAKTDPGELTGDIEFSHISFRYQADGPLILNDVSFRARPGEFIALVGPSGSGKSTSLRLILGFDQPAAGSIYFDGQDLPSLDIQAVRRQIGVVLQSGKPIVGDIYNNIVGNNPSLTIDDAWEAARMAGLEDDIRAMPMGMHTVISEGAGTFSGGQRQRLMIARAIVNRPRILLFDEATSALDNRTQEIVSRSLASLKATRIVIAHRLSTILHADRIYVIEAGRVVEFGNYEELMAKKGLFSELASRQQT